MAARLRTHPRLRIVFRIIVAAFILVLAALCFLVTSPGLGLAAKAAGALVSSFSPFSLHLHDVSGTLPFRLHVGRLELLDRAGPWLTLDDLSMRLQSRDLLHGALRLAELNIASLRVERRPIKEKRFRIPPIPGLAHYPLLAQGSVDRLSLGESVLGRPVILKVEGSIDTSGSGAGRKVLLRASRLDGKRGTLDVSYVQTDAAPAVGVTLDDADILPHLLGLQSPVQLTIDGSGPRTNWLGTLHAVTDAQVLLHGELRLTGEFPTVITASADTNLVPSKKFQALERFLGTEAHFTGSALLAKSGQFDVLDALLSSPRGSLQCAGTAQLADRTIALAFQGNHADLMLLTCREPDEEFTLPAGFCATLNGPFSDMTLRLDAVSRTGPLLLAETSIRPTDTVRMDGTAALFPKPFLRSDLPPDPADFAWSLAYDRAGSLAVTSLAMDHPVLQFLSSGLIEFPAATTRFDGTGAVHPATVPALARLLTSQSDLPFSIALSDRLHAPTVNVTLSPLNLAGGAWKALESSLRLGFHFEDGAVSSGTVVFRSDACAYGGARTTSASASAAFNSADLDAFALSAVTLAVPDMHLGVSGAGHLTRSTGETAFKGQARLENLADTAVLYPHTLAGSIQATLNIAKDTGTAPLECEASVDWRHPAGLPTAFQAAVGERVRADFRLQATQERLALENAVLTLPQAKITGEGWRNAEDGRFSVSLATKVGSIQDIFPPLAGRNARGALDLTAKIQGTPQDFCLKGETRFSQLAWDRVTLREARITFDGMDFPNAPQGKLSLVANNGRKGISLQGGLQCAYHGGMLSVENARLSAGKNRMAGALKWQREDHALSAEADFTFPAIDTLAPLLGVECSGSARGKIGAVQKKGRLDLDFSGKAETVRTPWLDIDTLDATGSLDDCLGRPRGKASLRTVKLHRGALDLNRANVAMDGDGSRANVTASLDGIFRRNAQTPAAPFDFNIKAGAALNSRDVTVSEASGTISDVPLSLAAPLPVHYGGPDYALGPMRFRCGTGEGNVSLHGSRASLQADASWKDVPLLMARVAGMDALDGTASGSLALNGPLQSPAFTLDMTMKKVHRGPAPDTVGLDATIKAVRDGQWTDVRVDAAVADAIRAEITSRLPLDLACLPPSLAIRSDDALQAQATLSADLTAMAGLLGRVNDLPQGTAKGTFRLDGTVNTPRVSGDLRLENGGYEHLRYGAVLKNLNLHVVADGSTFRIAECAGTDGSEGTVTASGGMELSFLKRHPFNVEVKLNRMRSLRVDYGTAMLSGSLRCSGNLDAAQITGAVVVNEGDFELPDSIGTGAAAKVEYTVVHGAQPPEPPKTTEPAATAVNLDLSVSVPGRVFLRAPVLETEWKGDMRFVGPLTGPRAEGDIRITRGYLDLVGQRFSLADSTVGFYRGDLRTPYMNVTGVCVANDITARIQVTGPPNDAQLNLTSDPALPQDEILSKLLFRKGVSQASPLQAIQIARTASMFSGHLSLPQFLTGSVKFPGVDLFDIRTGEKVDETVVGVGKYINDKIYVEAEQGASSESGRVSAQVEVTPRVSVKADVGARNRGGVGILWKKDY